MLLLKAPSIASSAVCSGRSDAVSQHHVLPAGSQQRGRRCMLPQQSPRPAGQPFARRTQLVCSATAAAPASTAASGSRGTLPTPAVPLKVVIAGAGISGLSLAVGLLKKGYEVVVLERDLTAIRGEGKYRGPIQVQSNALGALEALDKATAERVYQEGCVTGDRVNGLCDGITGDWYVKFDTYHPAIKQGLPATRVICRHTLQWILADTVRDLGGDNVIVNDVHVVDYAEKVDPASGKKTVQAICADGRVFEGDMLVGADGIWSKVRTKMVGHTEAFYSDYTCFTGISDFTPPDIDVVAYRVFLGNGQYFVSSDVGGGKMQWYAFHKEPPGMAGDKEGCRKQRLVELFGGWSHMVLDLIRATPEEDILRRDIYDRAPIFKWSEGRVALLGDSAHAMQPNLGQGGCMAIEDAYQLVLEISKGADKAAAAGKGSINVEEVLHSYFKKRVMRVSSIHGFARFAANMASTYKSYLGEGLGPLSWIQKFKIPHPGKLAGQPLIKLSMPPMLGWILGGYNGELRQSDRAFEARPGDAPKGFDPADFDLLMADDDALLHAVHAHWVLVPTEAVPAGGRSEAQQAAYLRHLAATDPKDEKVAATIGEAGVVVGRSPGSGLLLDCPTVSSSHARLERQGRDYYVADLGSQYGTFVNGRQLPPRGRARLLPGDVLRFGLPEDSALSGAGAAAANCGAALSSSSGGDCPGNVFTVKLQHDSLLAGAGHGQYRREQTPAAARAFALYEGRAAEQVATSG
ncbi:hypothetical protein N2152v2_006699 [Parachlorella kessleri]